MKESVFKILNDLFQANPALEVCRDDISKAFEALRECYINDKMILTCGNGGSAADSEHIVGELMKGFRLKRELSSRDRGCLYESAKPAGSQGELAADGNDNRYAYLAGSLQGALPAVSLVSQTALATAFANDVAADMIFAQQVFGYRKLAGTLIGISTSGNAANVANAVETAKAFGIKAIGLTGKFGGKLKEICDITIRVPAQEVYRIQEYHLPVYHALCAMLEEEFFGNV